MLGDRDRIELGYSLLFSLPGAPLLVYGDEIGMGEDRSPPGRNAVRTPMQWADEPNRGDPDSLLRWFGRLVRARHARPEIGAGSCEVLDADDPAVFAHRIAGEDGAVVAVHNLDGYGYCWVRTA